MENFPDKNYGNVTTSNISIIFIFICWGSWAGSGYTLPDSSS